MITHSRSGGPLGILRLCLHLLVAVLLGVVTARAAPGPGGHFTAVLAAAAAMAAIYAAGSLLPGWAASRPRRAAWLAVLAAAWLVLLALTPDAVWLTFPLIIIASHLLPARWGLAAAGLTTGLAIAGFAWHQGTLTTAGVLGPVIGAAVAAGTVLGYQALYRESEQRRRLIEQLTTARAELAAAERAAGVLAERERLAREIHDTLAQGLSSIQLLLRAAERALPGQPETAVNHVRHARTTAQENLAEARRFVRALAPPGLDGGSLAAALRRLCAATAERSGLAVEFRVSGDPAAVATQREVALLRIAQSALGNTVQHAAAARAVVMLTYTDGGVALDVADDGKGFDPALAGAADHAGTADQAATEGGGFGLAAMRARALALGGTMSVQSAPGRGTTIAVSFPAGPDPVTP